ncbi:MAG: dephospho-CoA kinase [Salegentibacter sp.]|uniref:dephospho-CoA kinase n=1 Tax=Salegentibacter sp. TaxID=1903072 RepID=UPI0028702566|nr:dephospho-CoA kinase [Salegentibacter sp.]MDR9457896.1 dephospho-CoA kinase [Salegentibacter sp.]
MMVVGLTGGIGSGKTTVANFFRELGIPVYIADEAGKRLMLSSEEIKKAVRELFGEQAYPGDEPDRKYIASQVFNDSEKLEALNNIIHPAVAADFQRWLSRQDAPYIIYEAAILFETGGNEKCDRTILVTAPHDEKIKRLQFRDNSEIEEIEARMANQWSDEKKLKLADFQIKNTDLALTKSQVEELHEILLNSRKN